MIPKAVKAWCPDDGEVEPEAPNVSPGAEDYMKRAAEEAAARVYGTSDDSVIEVHVRDEAGELHAYHVEVDTSPRFDAYYVGPA